MSVSDWGVTRQIPAQVTLVGDVLVEGELHLLARTSYPPGPETPLEMLNRPDGFFALTILGQGPILVSKAQVAIVSCPDDVALFDPDRASVAKDAELRVELMGGAEYRGRARFELPPSSSRVLDYVNGPGLFFVLHDQETVRYVNKSFVRLIRPFD